MRVLQKLVFSEDLINIDGHQIRPIDVTSKLLFPMGKLKEGEERIYNHARHRKGTSPMVQNLHLRPTDRYGFGD